MQTEVAFLGNIVGCAGLACDLAKLSAVRAWQVRQCVGFVGYYRRFIVGTSCGLNLERGRFGMDFGKTESV